MSNNQHLTSSNNRRVSGPLSVPGMPLEWLDARSWRLPSGKALAEFALQAGFLAPLLFRSEASRATGGSLAGAVQPKTLRKGETR